MMISDESKAKSVVLAVMSLKDVVGKKSVTVGGWSERESNQEQTAKKLVALFVCMCHP